MDKSDCKIIRTDRRQNIRGIEAKLTERRTCKRPSSRPRPRAHARNIRGGFARDLHGNRQIRLQNNKNRSTAEHPRHRSEIDGATDTQTTELRAKTAGPRAHARNIRGGFARDLHSTENNKNGSKAEYPRHRGEIDVRDDDANRRRFPSLEHAAPSSPMKTTSSTALFAVQSRSLPTEAAPRSARGARLGKTKGLFGRADFRRIFPSDLFREASSQCKSLCHDCRRNDPRCLDLQCLDALQRHFAAPRAKAACRLGDEFLLLPVCLRRQCSATLKRDCARQSFCRGKTRTPSANHQRGRHGMYCTDQAIQEGRDPPMAEWCDFDESKEVRHARRGQTWHLATRPQMSSERQQSSTFSNPDKKLVSPPRRVVGNLVFRPVISWQLSCWQIIVTRKRAGKHVREICKNVTENILKYPS